MNLTKYFHDFKSKRILIVGDAIIDTYLWGEIHRMSPEAPVPVVDVAVNQNDSRLGGAANVALNLKELGAESILCTVIGNDNRGIIFEQLMQEQGLSLEGMLISNGRKTTTKTRVIADNKHQLRIDEEDTYPIKVENQFYNLIEKLTHNIDAIILQDYNKGVLTETIIEKIISLANSKNIPTVVDPKKQNFLSYKQCTLFKPNLKEINEGLNTNPDINNFSEIEEVTSKLRNIISAKAILLTLSNKGIFLNTRSGSKIKESTTSNVIDVSGAGDTVVSVAAMCLACNIDFEELAILSNIAGGIVCEKVGVVPITNKELLDRAKKLLDV
ncbi:MAG: bifunctional heptose 7-phosphate kinase/heptose 1-phosphate adenyltransferase [Flavobacteriales bacterium]|jgi:rfaE bifunctional protein kinase chain/domain